MANRFFAPQKLCVFLLLPVSVIGYDTATTIEDVSQRIFSLCKDKPEEQFPQKMKTMNVARGKPVTASSTFCNSPGFEGSILTNGNMDDFAHTDLEDNPWFEIDLGGDYIVEHITVHNRKGTAAAMARANNFKLDLLDASRKALTFHGPEDMSNANVADFDLFSEQQGLLTNNSWCFLTRYVKVQLPSHDYLNLAEVQVFAYDNRQTAALNDESTLKYGQKIKLYLPDYGNVYITGCRDSGNFDTELRLEGNDIPTRTDDFSVKKGYDQPQNNWAPKEGIDATYGNEGTCVRYGDTVILQNNFRSDRFLSFRSGGDAATFRTDQNDYRKFYWIFRSVDNGHDPSFGECIRHFERVFIQNYWDTRYLEGYYQKLGQSAHITAPNDPKYFKWAMRVSQQESKRCKAQNVKGRWVNTGFTNGVSTATREKGVLRGESSSYTSESYWQQSVSASMSLGCAFGSVSVSATSKAGGSISESVETLKDVTTTSTIEHTFNDAGVVWQFVYDVDDSCYQKTTIAGDQLVMTPSLKEKPCCVPPLFLDMNNPHGPCVDGTPCDCAPEICNPLEQSTNNTSPDLPAHSLQYGQVIYLENKATQGHYLTGGRGLTAQNTFTKEKDKSTQEEQRLGYYQWTVRSSLGMTGTPHDVDPKEDDCVRYGDSVYLQVNGFQDRYLKFDGVGKALTEMPDASSDWFLWKPRSVGAGLNSQDPQEGECIILDGSVDLSLQNAASSKWLGGGHQDVWTSVKEASNIEHPTHFVWKLRKNYHDYGNSLCEVKDIVGVWEHKLVSNGDVSLTQEYGVVKTDTLTGSRKRDWEKEVTVTAEGGIGSASGSVSSTSTWGGSQSHEVSRTAQQSAVESYQVDFDGGGLVWQFVYNINDGCGSKLKTRSLVLTKSVVETPCCNPGTFLNPNVVHGPCIEGAPCFCGEEVCNAPPAAIGTCDCDKFNDDTMNHFVCEHLFDKYDMCLGSMI